VFSTRVDLDAPCTARFALTGPPARRQEEEMLRAVFAQNVELRERIQEGTEPAA
jgi:hypothetical protein